MYYQTITRYRQFEHRCVLASLLLLLVVVFYAIKVDKTPTTPQPIKETQSDMRYVALADSLQRANAQLSRHDALIYADAIIDASERYGVSEKLIKGVIITESHARPYVKNHNSTCFGSMQVSARWWSNTLKREEIIRSDEDYFDIRRGVFAGTYVLKHYLDRTHSVDAALRRYSGAAKGYAEKVKRNMEI